MTEGRTHFPVEPWSLTEVGLDLASLGVNESVFALANGHVGFRGTFEEGEPSVVPGTYLNGFFEERPLPYAEAGYGFPEQGQTVVNVTDGKIIRLLVGDSPLDLAYGEIIDHRRTLDLRAGVLRRVTEWRSPNGRTVRVTSTRLVSLTRRSIAAIEYQVECTDDQGDLYIALQSDLLANEDTPGGSGTDDPRAGAALKKPLVAELATAPRGRRAVLVHSTRRSKLRVAVAMDHDVDVPDAAEESIEAWGDLARFQLAARLTSGTAVRIVKYLAYGWSSRRSAPALRDQVEGGLATAKLAGWERLVREQRELLDQHWAQADVEIVGDDELQQAVRVGMFHVLQAGLRAERQPIPAKGLTGDGYDGHTFWDTETYVLPVLTYTAPGAVRDALRWRHSTLDLARERARVLGQNGAAFPWRTIRGEETSGYWPAGTAAFHINADIADAVARYTAATQDGDFDRDYGAELLIETARLWASLGHFDDGRGFRIDGVTGPDEYTAIVDNNVYTNLMAQKNLREAAAAVRRQPDVAGRLDVSPEETAHWERAAEAMVVPWDDELGVHMQSNDFTRHEEWDFAGTPAHKYPLLLHFPYFEIYRTQVVKQADLVMALHLRGDAFTLEEKIADFAYYEARTVRDSSLSAAQQAVVAAETGHLELAHDYWGEAALTDLQNLHGNSGHGLHIASLAGGWTVAVAGFGGMRDHGGALTFAPRLPPRLSRLAFRVVFQGRVLSVEVTREAARYRLVSGDPLQIAHHGAAVTVTGETTELPVPPPPRVDPVRQPHGAAPRRRSRPSSD
ncbi:family 65 glycosyl hydrolase [Modestobacter sp. I12A-02628]|uniref:Glycoside hydrolase family 65 protein n=1 Tax=Goekera deserti TaxID=2497753 RepID=A0A7K3WE40_9ACTN|nr:glycoside hydrolase family 65 protein [Goekera deserti]MPQ99687.1 family 65 glycosyl hydrolase [Goekera deserti]NDI46303.1 family 65 glycosyl hydrolase [Goekera deserti]NEL54765.1 glycoside hydrolase family 65 protein [Goekera deserti]